jgi:hypothetical protein
MKYVLEFYYLGDCIERREQDQPFPSPVSGDQLYIEFDNPSYLEEYGSWWTVKRRSHLFFNQPLYTLMLHCEPNPSRSENWD